MAKKRRAAGAAKQAEKVEEEPREQQAGPSEEAAGGSEPSSNGGGSASGGSSGSGGSGSEGSSSDGGSSAPEVSDEEGEDADDEDGEAYEQVDVDFQFFDPAEADFHGLKALLHTYLDGSPYDGSGLADAIIAQRTVGTVVKTGEDDDPIAVMTALNTQRYAERPFMREVRDYVLAKCGDEAVRRQFEEAWGAAGSGLLLNERLINSPPSLAPPLVQALLDEVGWATEDEPTQELRDSFKLERYILVTRVYTDAAAAAGGAAAQQQDGGGAGPSGGGGKAKKKKQKTAGAAPVLVYVRPEDEYLHAAAAASFTWPIEGRAVAKDELKPLRLALLVGAGPAASARAQLDRVVGNAAAMGPPPPALAAGRGGGGGGRGRGRGGGRGGRK
ncbi:MAG: p21-C-terminal region-binding protein-domain-containing protein [Monoraphidium minutum]|nr:MAG: p21-C-terminal region-binding protein-domain-containing protein [Monoraphidium minutum]